LNARAVERADEVVKMKPGLSLTLIASLVAMAPTLAAQEKTETPVSFDRRGPASRATAGPLADAITREAVRLAVAEVNGATPGPMQSTDNDAWSHVRQLAAGEDIRVVLGDATSHRGAFRIADDESITLVIAGHDQRVSRAGIRRILVARGTHRRRNVLRGLVIGGASGVLVAALHCRGEAPSCKEVAPAYVYPLAGGGAGIGALLPARERQQIYPAVLKLSPESNPGSLDAFGQTATRQLPATY
jgi:hypothetical protein